MKLIPLFLTAAAFVIAADAHAAPEKTKPYELKNRSTFTGGEDSRIPFWPIGFQRPGKAGGTVAATVAVAPKIQLEARHFNVTSILLGNPALATINGRSFGEGEILPVVFGTERLRVVVNRIGDGMVTLGYEGLEIQVPMRRAELGVKQAQMQSKQPEFIIQIGSPAAK